MISTKYKAIGKTLKNIQLNRSQTMNLSNNNKQIIQRSSLHLSCSEKPFEPFQESQKSSNFKPSQESVSQLQIQGHRGAGPKHNTLGAFQMAIDFGLDAVELDVWLTKDKKLAVFHGEGDFGLIPYQGEKIRITELTMDQIRTINVHNNNHDEKEQQQDNISDSSSVSENNSFSQDQQQQQVEDFIPTLEEALLVCKGKIRVNIELKGGDDEEFLVQSTIDLVHELEMDEQIELSSFQHRFCPIATAYINEKNKKEEKMKKQIKFGFLVEFKSDISEELLTKADLEGHSLNFPPDFLECQETVEKLQKLNQNSKMMLTTWFSYDIEETQALYDKLMGIGVSCIITNQPEYINNYKKGVLG